MKNYIVGFIAVVALVVGVIGISKQPVVKQGSQGQQGVQGLKGDKGDRGIQGIQGERGSQGQKGESGAIGMPGKLGAVSGPDISSPYLSVNGVTTFYHSDKMSLSTTTPCAFRSPGTATSTLVFASAHFDVSSTTASTITIAKATNSGATTTWIQNASIAANAQGTVVPPGATTTNQTFAPNDWIVVGMSGGNGTFSPTGNCKAGFRLVR